MNGNSSISFYVSKEKIKFALLSLSIATVLLNSPVGQTAQVKNNQIWMDDSPIPLPIEARMGTLLDNRKNLLDVWSHRKLFWYGTNDKKCSGVIYNNQNQQILNKDPLTGIALPDEVNPNPVGGCEQHVNAYSSTDLVHWHKEDSFKVKDDNGNIVAVGGGNLLFNPTNKTYLLYGKDHRIYSSTSPVGTFQPTGNFLSFGYNIQHFQ